MSNSENEISANTHRIRVWNTFVLSNLTHKDHKYRQIYKTKDAWNEENPTNFVNKTENKYGEIKKWETCGDRGVRCGAAKYRIEMDGNH